MAIIAMGFALSEATDGAKKCPAAAHTARGAIACNMISAMSEQVHQSAQICKFDFHGDALDVVFADGEHWVVLARLCEPLAIKDVKSQAEKLKGLPWARWGIFAAPSGRGIQDFFCLNIRSVSGWLFTVNSGKVAPHLRKKLAEYQSECAEALSDYFLGRRGAPPVPAELPPEALAAIRLVPELFERLAALEVRHAEVRSASAPCIGPGAARAYILDPLKEIARVETKAVGRAAPAAIRSLRFAAERRLRKMVSFPMAGGQCWANFPTARLAAGVPKQMQRRVLPTIPRSGAPAGA